MSESIIKMEQVAYHYPSAKVWALRDLNLEISKGEFIAIMGENGAGKTTFCNLINGIIPNSLMGTLRGTVTVDGMDTRKAPISTMASKVGMVLEDPETQLFSSIIRSEVAFGPENLKVPVAEITERVSWALEVVGLTEYATREPAALSGGQKQRLAIACALAMLPSIMVLDEPTSQLDPIGTREVFSVIRKLREEMNMTILIATHKSEEIAEFADRVLVLKEGRPVAFDTPRVVFANQPLLDECWIRAPHVSAVANQLAGLCQPLPGEFPVLLSEAETEIMLWMERRRA